MKKILPVIIIGILAVIILGILFIEPGTEQLRGNSEEVSQKNIANQPSNQASQENTTNQENVTNQNNATPKRITNYIDIITGENYYVKYKGTIEGQEVVLETTKKGEDIAANFGNMGYGVINKEGYTYTIMHEQKTYIKTKDTQDSENSEIVNNDIYKEYNESKVTIGKEEVNGVMYDYEEYDNTKLYFLNDTLKYMKADDQILEVLELSDKSKDSLFDIPSDYVETTM